MRVPTTISPGPTSTDLKRLDQEIESHPIWTELRGPVKALASGAFGIRAIGEPGMRAVAAGCAGSVHHGGAPMIMNPCSP
jgi:hypothetical protein